MAQGRSLRAKLLLAFAALATGCLAALVGGLGLALMRGGDAPTLVLAGIVAGFSILGMLAWGWLLADTHLARPIDRIAGDLRARAVADSGAPIDSPHARHLADLAPAAQALAHALSQSRAALQDARLSATAQLTDEKRRLEALLSELTEGIILCSAEHSVVFYNALAADLIGVGGLAAGLDRNLFDYLRDGPIRLAYRRLQQTGDPDAASDILCATRDGGHVFSARMRMVADAGQGAAYVLTLRDVTAELAVRLRRDALLSETLDHLRRPAANLSVLLAAMPDDGADTPVTRALRAEVGALAKTVGDLARQQEELLEDGNGLAMTRTSDLIDGIRARLEGAGLTVKAETEDLYLRCNGFEIVALIAGLAEDIAADSAITDFHLSIAEEGAGALIRLEWAGDRVLLLGKLDHWLAAPLEPGLPGLSRAVVLRLHGREIWPEASGAGLQSLCLPISQVRRVVQRPKPVTRTVVYDFDLLSKSRAAGLEDRALSDLTCVVFDTETTGLLPDRGDEVVQIAAVRIVNGRRIEGEVFDTLVNPRRTIPRASTAVHGITDAMVQGAPMIEEVAARFHRFAEGAVLIAHNAPFDMQFLRRAGKAIGKDFDHPILDTVLLSAVVYGQHEVHSLDALTHRLGITISEEARHTAIGDTVATADAYLKLQAMLAGRGLVTFGQVLAEVRRHGRLLQDLN